MTTIPDTSLAPAEESQPRVLILYDRAPAGEPSFVYGRLMAQMLQNLLGHFPHLRQVVVPIDCYSAGSTEDFHATFYLGSYYGNHIPAAFLRDYAQTRQPVVWLGYNVWQLGADRLTMALGLQFRTIAQPDWTSCDRGGIPGFFREHDYLGQTFTKFAAVTAPNVLRAAHDVVMMHRVPGARHDIMSWARHTTRDEATPYVVRRDNRWFVADLPFTYIHEADRYLIFADLLFDMLGECPRHQGRKPALLRFEDVHSAVPDWQLDALIKFTRATDIPFAVSVIPKYSDPYGVVRVGDRDGDDNSPELPPRFARWLQGVRSGRGSIVMHGYTHQADLLRNPDGVSGRDYEFWDEANNCPHPNDSSEFVLKRLESGVKRLDDAGLRPIAWLTPHYAASALDNVIFGQTFSWCIGRIPCTLMIVSQSRQLPDAMTFDRAGSEASAQRLEFFRDLEVTHPEGNGLPTLQFVPYEIHGDIYGARMLPETLGYLRPGEFEVDDALRILSRNAQLRDVWGSMYIHPDMLRRRGQGGLGRFDGDTEPLERLVRGARALGYEFVDLAAWTHANIGPRRPEPVEEQSCDAPAREWTGGVDEVNPAEAAVSQHGAEPHDPTPEESEQSPARQPEAPGNVSPDRERADGASHDPPEVSAPQPAEVRPALFRWTLHTIKRHQQQLAGLTRAALPERHYVELRRRYRRLAGQQAICPVCNQRFTGFQTNAWGETTCAGCQSFPRTRAAMLYLRALLADGRRRRVLHFAPFPKKAEWLEAMPGISYVDADHPLAGEVYRSRTTMRMDLERLPCNNDVFDLLIAIGVVQFVLRDAPMFAEVARVLKPGGVFVFETTIFGPRTTECYTTDELASLEYGVKDSLDGLLVSNKWRKDGRLLHDPRQYVRQYGLDIRQRLERAGFAVNPIRFSVLCAAAGELPETFGLRDTADHLLFECLKLATPDQTAIISTEQ